MPKLPFAGFTASGVGARPSTPASPRVTAESFGAPQARAQAQLGREVTRLGVTLLEREQERERRKVQVEAAKASAEFAADLDVAVKEGGDFQSVSERYEERVASIGENIVTRGGRAAHEVTLARTQAGAAEAIRVAESKRAGLETKQQTRELANLLGANVLVNPASVDVAIGEMDDFIGTFSQLSPEESDILKQSMANELSRSAADGLLRNDPLVLQETLTKGGLENLTPAQRASYLHRADAELRRVARESQSQDEMAKLLTRQALADEANDHVLTNDEAQEWFDRGVTASQFDAAIAKSVEAEEARQKLARDTQTILSGGGAALKQDDYENALSRLTQDATKNMDPEQAAQAAVNMRVEAAVQNGREDSKVKSLLNAGPAGGDATFEAGLALRADLGDRSPELLHKMMDGNARRWYNAYDFMTQQLGLSSDAARSRLLETSENLKDTESRLNSKDNRELIEDAVDVGHEGQNALIQAQVAKSAAHYMALVPTLTPDQAVELAAKDFGESTVEIGSGVRAPITGVPVNWEPADRFVRRSALRRDMREAGIEMSTDELDDAVFIPNGDGTTAVIGPDNLIIFPAWDWQGAVNEWWTTIGQADVAIEQKRKAKESAKARKRSEQVGEILGSQTFSGPGL